MSIARTARPHGRRHAAAARDHGLAQRRLTEATHLLASSLDLRQVLDRFATITLEVMEVDVVRIWLIDGTEHRLGLAIQAGTLRPDVEPPHLPERGKGLTGCILAAGSPVTVHDLEHDPRVWNRAWFAAQGLRSFLGVPLVVDEAAVGVMACMTRTARAWSAEDTQDAEALATTAAVAIRNARLHAETREQLNQNETLLAVARAANSTLDFTEVMRRVARATGRAIGADMVGAYLPDADRKVLRPVAGYHVPHELLQRFLDFPLDVAKNSYIEEGWRTQQPAWCADAQTDGRSDPALIAWAPLRSIIFFPLVVKDEPIGALFLIWWAPRPAPTPAELLLIEGIARQTALAIGNARLFEARVRDAQRLEALNEVSRSLTAIRDPREIVDTIAVFAADLVDARLVRLWLLDTAAGDLTLVASGGEDAAGAASASSSVRIDRGTGLIGAILESRAPLFIADIRQDPRWLNRALSERLGLCGFAGVPLVVNGEAIGVLSLLTRRRGDFTPGQRRLIEAFTSQAALAIHNTRTFAELQRRLRETEALLGVAESVSRTRDIGEVMRRVCREAARALGADSGVFYVADESTGQVVPAAGYRVPKALLASARPLRVDEVPTPMNEARQARQVLFVPDVAADPRFNESMLSAAGVRSVLMSPIGAQERHFGDVLLYWWEPRPGLSDSDQALIVALSAQAALALENARLVTEIESQASALREKNAELDTFVYTVSHDLKAPLVTIQGMSGMVLEEYAGQLDEDGRHYLERIAANTQQMERLILDLLALSRSGREGRAPEEVALAEVVDEVLAGLAQPIQARGIEVVVGDLPTIHAVRVQMEQVMRNLLTNAIKYMGDTASPRIEIGAASRSGEAEIWVRDTGIGIDPAYHEKVFEIFQRLKEIEAEGSGVGLPIVKKIVQAAGGRIWVESARGQGSTFRFTWPAGARR